MEHIVLYDGICNLCNRVVSFIRRQDNHNRFLFVPLQSEKGKEVLLRPGIEETEKGSVILLTGTGVYYRSEAVLRIFRILGGGWSVLYIFFIVPPVIRDYLYNIIARNRYRWKN